MPVGGKRVLVADDEPMVLRTIRSCLQRFGCLVETSPNGADALEKLGNARFDLVVTDNHMPTMDGCALAARIKAQVPELPILMITAYPPQRVPEYVDLLLPKPFTLDELQRAVERLLINE